MRRQRQNKKRTLLKGAIYANFRSQADFAHAVGLGEQQVSQVIHGRRRLKKEEMARIAQILNTPMRLLFPEADAR